MGDFITITCQMRKGKHRTRLTVNNVLKNMAQTSLIPKDMATGNLLTTFALLKEMLPS